MLERKVERAFFYAKGFYIPLREELWWLKQG